MSRFFVFLKGTVSDCSRSLARWLHPGGTTDTPAARVGASSGLCTASEEGGGVDVSHSASFGRRRGERPRRQAVRARLPAGDEAASARGGGLSLEASRTLPYAGS